MRLCCLYHVHGPTRGGFDFLVNYRVYPKNVDNTTRLFERIPDILEYIEGLYGVPYPWINFDQVTIPGIRGGAESTIAGVLGHVTVRDEHAGQDYPSDWLVAHEAAHHWFGNLVAYCNWLQTWISERSACVRTLAISKPKL